MLVLMRKGREVRFHVPPDDPSIGTYLRIYQVLLNTAAGSPALVRVERINGSPAVESPYLPVLLGFGFTRGHRDLVLRRGYR